MPWLLGLVVLIADVLAVYRHWYPPLCLRVGRMMTIVAVLAVLVWCGYLRYLPLCLRFGVWCGYLRYIPLYLAALFALQPGWCRTVLARLQLTLYRYGLTFVTLGTIVYILFR